MKRFATLLFCWFFCILAASAAAPQRPPITGIAYVRFAGLTGDATDDFYMHTLGLPRVKSHADGKDMNIFLVSATQSVQVVPTETPKPGSQLLQIGLYTTNLDEMAAYLKSKGVASRMTTNGLEVHDPENHVIVFRAAPKDAEAPAKGYGFQVAHRLVHAGIVVHDRAAEDHFYKDILDCHVYWHGGYKDGIDDWVNMQVPEGADWIEYMLNVPENADARTLGGAYHISLDVNDIQAANKMLLSYGWNPTNGAPRLGLDGKWQINLHDPLATRVEVMEFGPVKDPCCSPFTGTLPHE